MTVEPKILPPLLTICNTHKRNVLRLTFHQCLFIPWSSSESHQRTCSTFLQQAGKNDTVMELLDETGIVNNPPDPIFLQQDPLNFHVQSL